VTIISVSLLRLKPTLSMSCDSPTPCIAPTAPRQFWQPKSAIHMMLVTPKTHPTLPQVVKQEQPSQIVRAPERAGNAAIQLAAWLS
jgi:hypothetical protein